MDLNDRLQKLIELIRDKNFITGKGLANEENIRIFAYDPSQEILVKNFLDTIPKFFDTTEQTEKVKKIKIINLFEVLISICDDLEITNEIPELEESDGTEYMMEQLRIAAEKEKFIEKINYEPHESGDVMIITGIGDVYPFLRIHSILEWMQPYFHDIAIIVMYPGTYDGNSLSLFGRLPKNNYYRAFIL